MALKLFKSLLFGACIISLGGAAMAQASTSTGNAKSESWDKTFAKSPKVEVQKVSFKNRYGIVLVGDLYIPKDLLKNPPKDSKNTKLPAIAISGPFGAVKEQASGLYAQTLAKQGFITLAFDPSFTGESALANQNLPQNVASPDINTEDFSAAVDFLANHARVDSSKIGILGICGFGGFALNAAAMDTRIKAVVTSTMYDMTRVSAHGYNDSMSDEDLYKMREEGAKAKITAVEGSGVEKGAALYDGDKKIGEVITSTNSVSLGDNIGLALMDSECAYPSLELSTAPGGEVNARTVTRPMTVSESLIKGMQQ